MLQAILKVMELFGGAHGAQKILNYRFWQKFCAESPQKLFKNGDERQNGSKKKKKKIN